MTLEELIYKRLAQWKELTNKLAVYGEQPAIFYASVPDDLQEGWGRKKQYPRICYTYDMQVNPERASVGTMELAIYCERSDSSLSLIEQEVKSRLKDVLMKPNEQSPYCFTWSSTEAFQVEGTKVIGVQLHFDIREYPSQESTDPDPIMGVAKFIKERYPDAVVLGWDRLGDYTDAADAPIFYCRLDSLEKAEETYTVSWMDGRIAVHFLCPKSDIRIKMITALANQLSVEGEVILLDSSPMFIKRLQLNQRSDYLTEGQLFITGKYGILKYFDKPHRIAAVKIETN